MQFTFTSALLMAGMATASSSSFKPETSSVSIPPSSALSSRLSAIESSSTFTPRTSSVSIPSISIPPSGVLSSRLSAIPTASYSSISVAASSDAASVANSEDYDCVYHGWGCDWVKSEYGYGSEFCGSSPFKSGQQLSDGSQIIAVSKDGSGDCKSKAGAQCCKVVAEEPCKLGEKYLECHRP